MSWDRIDITIPFRTPILPIRPSLSEIRHLHGMLRTQAKGHIDEHQLFAMHERQRDRTTRARGDGETI
jgi:hypothetical protein